MKRFNAYGILCQRAGLRWLIACLLPICTTSAASRNWLYERDIAPILRTYCAGCHNDADREGEFSVETFASLNKGGDKGVTLKPGDPENSLLVKLIEARGKPSMPPKDEPRVPAAELALLRQWIADGAPGPQRDESLLKNLVVPEVAVGRGVARPWTAVEYSPDGKILALGTAGRVEFRNASGRRIQRVIDGIPGKVNALHFSADGATLVVAAGITGIDGVAELYSVATGQKLVRFEGHRDAVQDAELSPDGRWLATAGYDRSIRLWKVADHSLVWSNSVHNGAVFDLAFDPSGTVLASASADQTVKLWRVRDGLRLDTLNQPQGDLNRVLFTPDGQHLLAVGADRRIHQWRFVSREAPALNPVVTARFAHEAGIVSMVLSRDGRHLVTGAIDRSLKQWRLPELQEVASWTGQPDVAAALAMDRSEDRVLVARMDGSVKAFGLKGDVAAGSGGMGTAKHGLSKASPPGRSSASSSAQSLRSPIHQAELEPNDGIRRAQPVAIPSETYGRMGRPGDVDHFAFQARAGEALTLEVQAARDGSAMDSRLEVLTAAGQPVEQAVLQAVRDSWFTFRGKDSDTVDDFRLQNWAEMELDEYLYANGEVVRLWLYPRGPDSGFKVYPGEGRRQSLFGTTPLSHALNEPAYLVKAYPAGSRPIPNGLPVFRLNYQNDDDPSRLSGTDSMLLFTAPTTGRYLVRVTDTRGFGGGTNHAYRLSVRPQQPEFTVRVDGMNPKVSPGSGREIRFVATRREGFEGPIRIHLDRLPAGFTASTPVEIEAGQIRAVAVLYAAVGAADSMEASDRAVRVSATAQIQGREVRRELGDLGNVQLDAAPKLTVEILPGPDRSVVRQEAGRPMELLIRPGQTITARVRADRRDFKSRIELGGEDSGRNLPHGVYVDNIGLNGLLIVEDQTEREFFITAARKARPGTRLFHLRANGDGGQCSQPVLLRILEASPGQ
ncbi:MAG: hypothetical protein EXS21_01930 [Pedosphaera sp.]|nr:hypothetical protein [Pedosphaera sp.]